MKVGGKFLWETGVVTNRSAHRADIKEGFETLILLGLFIRPKKVLEKGTFLYE